MLNNVDPTFVKSDAAMSSQCILPVLLNSYSLVCTSFSKFLFGNPHDYIVHNFKIRNNTKTYFHIIAFNIYFVSESVEVLLRNKFSILL